MNPDKRLSFDGLDFFDGPTYPTKPTESDLLGQNEGLISAEQYILETLAGIENRLGKVEDSISRQGEVICCERYAIHGLESFGPRTARIRLA